MMKYSFGRDGGIGSKSAAGCLIDRAHVVSTLIGISHEKREKREKRFGD